MNIVSPITQKSELQALEAIPVNTLVEKYHSLFDLDTSAYFKGIDQVKVYECKESGYQFFYPFNIDGDGKFYEKLEKYDWYYLPWKWEHEQTLSLLDKGQYVLEVGCGPASFLKKLKQENIKVAGLELNEHCVAQAQKEGLDVKLELVQNHAQNYPEQYDLVCSFQVLEHIAEVRSYIQASLDCLKPGGKLVVCVPNNGSFIKDAEWNVLNMPPHHMGLWKEESLRKLENFFPMKVEEIRFEPIEPRHYHWYRKVWERKHLPKENSFLYKLYHKIGLPKLVEKWIDLRRNKIHGHSIMAIYQKIS